MPSSPKSVSPNGKTPCLLPISDWPVCYAHGCYLNNRCPVYRGAYPSPVRDYIPHPPVFILLNPFEAIPISYRIKIETDDPDE
jgi:hypothetical protein